MHFKSTNPVMKILYPIIAAAFLTTFAQAQTTYWIGPNGGSMNTASNWSGNATPGNGAIMTFSGNTTGNLALNFNAALGGSTGATMNLTSSQNSTLTITNVAAGSQNLRFANSSAAFVMNAGAGAFTLGGSGTAIQIVLGNAGGTGFRFTNDSVNDAVFGSNVNWATGGSLAATLTFAGSGNQSVAGLLFTNALTSNLTKTGTGALTVSANNTFSGGVSLDGGTLALGHNNAFGSGTLTITSNANGFERRIQAADASARSIANNLSLGLSTTFGAAGTGDLAFSGTVTAGAQPKTWTVDSISAEFSNAISGSNTQTITGSGTLWWSGNNSATLTGPVTFIASGTGTLRISHPAALGGMAGNTTISGGQGSTNVLEILGGISLTENIAIGGKDNLSATLRNVSGNNTLTGVISFESGGTEYNIESAAGSLTINGNINGATGGEADRNYNFAGEGNIQVAGAINDGSLTNPTFIFKTGNGTLTLSGNNTFSGNATVSGGVLALSGGSAIPDSGILLINSPGVVNLTGTETVDQLFIGGTQQPAGNYTSSNPAFTGGGTLIVLNGCPGGTTYATWATTNVNNQASNLDFDGDGIDNGAEFFMGTAGNAFTPNPQPVAGVITWPVAAGTTGASAIVEVSTNLSDWTNAAVTYPGSVSDGSSQIQFTVPAGAGKLFYRLSVTVTP